MTEQLIDVVLRSIGISGAALLFSLAWCVPTSLFLGLRNFRGRRIIISIFNAFIGFPTVALGIILVILFSNAGPLGSLGLLYTPTGVIIGQALLVTPILVSLLTSAIESVDPNIKDLATTLGASDSQVKLAVLGEARKGTILAGIAAFNRAIGELGVALIVGGSLKGYTQVMTTQIALEYNRVGRDLSIQLTVVLLAIVFSLTLLANLLRRD
jgi:tungstate transport system permease protein